MEQKIDLSIFREKFILEAKDRIARMSSGLVYLEKNPGDTRLEADILREAHTLKGAAKMMGQQRIAEIAHRLEDALARRKERKAPFNKDLVDAAFQCFDILSKLVEAVRTDGGTAADEVEEIPALDRLKTAVAIFDGPPAAAEAARPAPSPAFREAEPEAPASAADRDTGRGIRVEPERLERLGNILTGAMGRQVRLLELRDRVREMGQRYRRTALQLQSAVEGGIAQGSVSSDFAARVASILKEGGEVFREVGTQLSEYRRREEEEATALSQNLEDLRSEVFAIRMIPLSPLFESFHRAVRDLAAGLEKEVELLVRGGKTEIDRKVAEAMTDPLIHLIRNAIDHGIESPAERREARKPPKGRIIITATPKKGRVVVEVEDDGRGIDLQEIRDTAVRKGMVTEKAAYRLDDREILSFIFRPGFTTAKTMTDLSGRGIGMDVVRATAERFNGSVEIFSTPGKGTRVVLELPFTTALSRVLLFEAGGQYFALPVMHTEGIFRFAPRELETVEGRRTVRFRGAPVPAVWLSRLLGLESRPIFRGGFTAVIVRHSQRRLALVVDRVEGESEIVVRDLGSYLGKVPLFMGTTILGTGDVALLLDVYDVISAVRLHPETAPLPDAGDAIEVLDILVVDDSLLAREMRKRVLASCGCRVETADGGPAALDVLAKKRFGLVVASARMQGMDGIEFVSRVRGTGALRDTPVLLVMGAASSADRERALAAGAAECIERDDFDREHLAPMIRRHAVRGGIA